MNELERIISKYFSKNRTGITYSDFNQEEVDKLFRNMKPDERPEILSILDENNAYLDCVNDEINTTSANGKMISRLLMSVN